MKKMKKAVVIKIKDKVVSWESHIDKKYGVHGTSSRSEFEMKAQSFILGELLKQEREKANLTQAEIAEKTGTKKVTFHGLKTGKPTFNYPLCIDLLNKV